jgi:hypothetical protein
MVHPTIIYDVGQHPNPNALPGVRLSANGSLLLAFGVMENPTPTIEAGPIPLGKTPSQWTQQYAGITGKGLFFASVMGLSSMWIWHYLRKTWPWRGYRWGGGPRV